MRAEVAMGIHEGVMERIKAQARQEYPNDYSMQAYTVEWEVEAYRELVSYQRPAGVALEDFHQILDGAEQEYPDDYSLQKYSVESEIRSYLKLHGR